MEQTRLNYGKTFLLGFGFFGVMILWAIYNAFVPIILADKFQFSPAAIGFFMTIDNIAALFIQPTIGSFSDRLRSPIGRRLPFIIFGAPIAAIAFGLVPLAAAPATFLACTVTTILAMAVWRTPVVALMPDVTPPKFRSQANGVINFMGGIGSIIAYLIGSKLYRIDPAYPFWLGSILVILAAALVFIFVKEPKVYEQNPNAERPNLIKSLKQIFQEKQHNTIRILFAIFFWFVAMNAIEAFLTLYATKYLGMEVADSVNLLTLYSLIFVIFALPAGFIGGKFGKKPTIMSGLIIMILAMLSMFFISKQVLVARLFNLPVIGVVPGVGVTLMIAGIGWALININSLPMLVDLTDAIHIGTYTGLYYLFSTLAAIAGPNINGWIVQMTGNNYASIMIIGPIFMAMALYSIFGIRVNKNRSEPQSLPIENS